METKDIIIFVAGLFASLIINYITQFTSNPLANKYREWQNKQAQLKAIRSVEKSKRRIEELDHELSEIRGFIENPVSFNAFAYSKILTFFRNIFALGVAGLVAFTYASLQISVNRESFLAGATTPLIIIFVIFARMEINTLKIFTRVWHFSEYNKNIQDQIHELQEVINTGKPEWQSKSSINTPVD